MKKILLAYTKFVGTDDGVEDPEFLKLLEDMAISNQVNTGDVAAWKGEAAKKQVNRLNRARQLERDKRNASKAAKLVKKAAIKKARALGVTAKRLIGKRKLGAAKDLKPALTVGAGGIGCKKAKISSGLPLEPKTIPAAAISAALPSHVSAVEAPASIGDWVVLAVDGGWLRFNPVLKRLDAHCADPIHNFDGKCKMDRVLSKGVIGLVMAWLSGHAEPFPCKASHQFQKVVLSNPDCKDIRERGREAFTELVEKHGCVFAQVWKLEYELRGTHAGT